MTYPKLNGRPMDAKRKRDFNTLRKIFRVEIARAAERNKEVLCSSTLTVAAWNCAFLAVTA